MLDYWNEYPKIQKIPNLLRTWSHKDLLLIIDWRHTKFSSGRKNDSSSSFFSLILEKDYEQLIKSPSWIAAFCYACHDDIDDSLHVECLDPNTLWKDVAIYTGDFIYYFNYWITHESYSFSIENAQAMKKFFGANWHRWRTFNPIKQSTIIYGTSMGKRRLIRLSCHEAPILALINLTGSSKRMGLLV